MVDATLLDRRGSPAPDLRRSVIVYREGNTARFVNTSTAVEKTFEVDALALDVIRGLDGRTTVEELSRRLRFHGPDADDRVRDVLDVLEAESLLELPVPSTEERFDRQIRLFSEMVQADSGYELDAPDPSGMQARLESAQAVVIGAGGTGSWVAHHLAASGVGTLRICDPDSVAISNLHRQLHYVESDVGKPKVEVLATRLQAMHRGTRIEVDRRAVGGEADVARLVEGAGVVVNCADRPDLNTTSDWVAAACDPRGIAHVVGGGYGYHTGMLATAVLPGRTTCWSCTRESSADAALEAEVLRRWRGAAATIGPFAATIGALTAWDAILVLVGGTPASAGRIGEFDFRTCSVRWRDAETTPGCRRCPPGAAA